MNKEISIHAELGITPEDAHRLAVNVHNQIPGGVWSAPFSFLGPDEPRVLALMQGNTSRWERLMALLTREDLSREEPSTRAGIEAAIESVGEEIVNLKAHLATYVPEAQGLGNHFKEETRLNLLEIRENHLRDRLERGLFVA